MEELFSIENEDFTCTKERIFKTDYLIGLYKDINDKFTASKTRANETIRELKEKNALLVQDVDNLKMDKERLSDAIRRSKVEEITKELTNLKLEYSKVEKKYQQNLIESQLTITELQEKIKQCCCEKNLLSPSRKKTADDKIRELKQSCSLLKESEHKLKIENNNLLKKLTTLQNRYLVKSPKRWSKGRSVAEIRTKAEQAEVSLHDRGQLQQTIEPLKDQHNKEILLPQKQFSLPTSDNERLKTECNKLNEQVWGCNSVLKVDTLSHMEQEQHIEAMTLNSSDFVYKKSSDVHDEVHQSVDRTDVSLHTDKEQIVRVPMEICEDSDEVDEADLLGIFREMICSSTIVSPIADSRQPSPTKIVPLIPLTAKEIIPTPIPNIVVTPPTPGVETTEGSLALQAYVEAKYSLDNCVCPKNSPNKKVIEFSENFKETKAERSITDRDNSPLNSDLKPEDPKVFNNKSKKVKRNKKFWMPYPMNVVVKSMRKPKVVRGPVRQKDTILEALQILQRNNINFTISSQPPYNPLCDNIAVKRASNKSFEEFKAKYIRKIIKDAIIKKSPEKPKSSIIREGINTETDELDNNFRGFSNLEKDTGINTETHELDDSFRGFSNLEKDTSQKLCLALQKQCNKLSKEICDNVEKVQTLKSTANTILKQANNNKINIVQDILITKRSTIDLLSGSTLPNKELIPAKDSSVDFLSRTAESMSKTGPAPKAAVTNEKPPVVFLRPAPVPLKPMFHSTAEMQQEKIIPNVSEVVVMSDDLYADCPRSPETVEVPVEDVLITKRSTNDLLSGSTKPNHQELIKTKLPEVPVEDTLITKRSTNDLLSGSTKPNHKELIKTKLPDKECSVDFLSRTAESMSKTGPAPKAAVSNEKPPVVFVRPASVTLKPRFRSTPKKQQEKMIPNVPDLVVMSDDSYTDCPRSPESVNMPVQDILQTKRSTNDLSGSRVPNKEGLIKTKLPANAPADSSVDFLSNIIDSMSKTGPAPKAVVKNAKPRVVFLRPAALPLKPPFHSTPETQQEKMVANVPELEVMSDDLYADCPRSPETVEVPDKPPKLIPTEKPKVMSALKVSQLLNRLLVFASEEAVVDEIVKEFAFEKMNFMAQVVLSKVSCNMDKPDNSLPPSPPLTSVQRILLGFLIKLDKSTHPGILDTFLDLAELQLYNRATGALRAVDPVTRLYTAVCRMRLDLNRIRRFICDSFYFAGDFAVPILFSVLTMWPNVLPMASELSDFPLAKIIVHLCYLKLCNDPGYNLMPLRDLLCKYYKFPTERWDCDELFQEIIVEYVRNPSVKLSEYTLLLFLKNKPPDWVSEKVQECLIPLYHRVPTANTNLKATLLILIGNIHRPFQLSELNFVIKIDEWFESLQRDEKDPVVQQSLLIARERLLKCKNSAIRKRSAGVSGGSRDSKKLQNRFQS